MSIFMATKQYEQQSFVQLLKTELIAHTELYDKIAPYLHRNKRNWNTHTTLNEKFFHGYQALITFKNEPDQVKFMQHHIESGHTGRLASMYNNRDAFYGMSSGMPLFDRRVLEFMFDVPIAEFRTKGTRRGIIRNAMDGLIPKEIQWRKDKLPYSPDYISRLLNSKQFVNTIIESEEYNFAWHFIDKGSIIDNIDNLKEFAGMGRVSEIAGVRIIQGIICVLFLKWLRVNNFWLSSDDLA